MRRIGTLPAETEALAVTPDGRWLIARDQNLVTRFSLEGGDPLELAELDGGRGLAISPDGKWLLCGDSFQLLRLSLDGGEPRPIGESDEGWEDGDFGVVSVAISPDGKFVAGCGGQNLAEVRDLDGKVVWRGESYKWPYVVRLTNHRIVVGTWDGSLAVRPIDEWKGGEPIRLRSESEYPGGPFFDLLLAGERVIACGPDNRGGWIKSGSGETWQAGIALPEGAHALALSPDGKRLICGGNDQALTLYDAVTLADLGRFSLGTHGEAASGHELLGYYQTSGPAAVRAVAWHPDGTRVYAGLDDGGLVEVTTRELEERTGAVNLLDLKRVIDEADRVLARQKEILEVFASAKDDPIGAFLRLEELDPQLAESILESGLKKLDQE